jgi:tetratricopeptide (TPR) repeat protein
VNADRALRSLINLSLVVPSDELKTFSLVPLVGDFLRKKRPAVVADTGNRLEQCSYALVVENGYRQHDRFSELDAAWPTVAAALPRFLGGANDRLQIVCDALDVFLNFTGRWDEWLALSRDAERNALEVRDFVSAGWRTYHAGRIRFQRRQLAEVLACADRAEAHWRQAQAGARERAFAVRLRGFGYELAKKPFAASSAYREAVELWRTLDPESRDVAIGLNDLAELERSCGDLDAAERDYCEALRISRVVGYREGIANCTTNLAVLAVQRRDWPGAESLAREALPLSEKIGRQELIGLNCGHLATALVRQCKRAEALPYAQRAVEIFGRLGSPELMRIRLILDECES